MFALQEPPGACAPFFKQVLVHIRSPSPLGGGTVNHELAPEVNEAMKGRWEPIYRSQLHYLVTWSTRGRKPVLRDRHVRQIQTLVHQACEERGYSLLEVTAGPDHVHVLVALRPSQSVASVV